MLFFAPGSIVLDLLYWGPAFLLVALVGGFWRVLRARHYLYLGVLAMAFYTLLLLIDGPYAAAFGEPWQPAVFLGAVVVTAGWMLANEVATRAARRRHTRDLIEAYRTGERHSADGLMIARVVRGPEEKLSEYQAAFDNRTDPLIQAVDRELAFFEATAQGIDSGDLDYGVVKTSLETDLCCFVEQMEAYIRHAQAAEAGSWAHLTRLYCRWRPQNPVIA